MKRNSGGRQSRCERSGGPATSGGRLGSQLAAVSLARLHHQTSLVLAPRRFHFVRHALAEQREPDGAPTFGAAHPVQPKRRPMHHARQG